ncbi:hypothetical protein QBC37DRAFT_403121 [Rhypophila decipiens]|uniref:Uncharacterized protein n=1 Tax=Rhypophila decipiens TaxID=261697 RepID=A0AAN7B5H4_9PEZI|nr:hypothetical protein QBC37DRAFT_403121 [Rhypophila decipiens]
MPEACSGCYSLLGRPITFSPSYMNFTTLTCVAFSVSDACPTTDVESMPPACLPATTTGYGFFSPGLEYESTCVIPATAISDISGSSPITYSTDHGVSVAPAIHIVWRPQDRFTTSSNPVPITTTSAHNEPTSASPSPKQSSLTPTTKVTSTSSTSSTSAPSGPLSSTSTSLSFSSSSSSSSTTTHRLSSGQNTDTATGFTDKGVTSTAIETQSLTGDATSSSSNNPPAAPPPDNNGGIHGLSPTAMQSVTATTVTVGVLGFLGFGLWFGKFRKRRKNSDDDEQNPTAPVDRAVLDGPIKPELPVPGPGERRGSGADGPNSNTGILTSAGTEAGGHGQYGDKGGTSQSELDGRAGVSSGLGGGGNISPIAEHPNEQDYLLRDGYGHPHELQSAGVGAGPHAAELAPGHRVSELDEQQRRVELEEQQRRFELEEQHERQRAELMAATPSPAPSYSQRQHQHPYEQPYGHQQHQPYQYPEAAELESPPGWSPRTPQSPSSPQSPRPPVSGPSSGHWSPQAPRGQAQGGDGYYDQGQGQGWGRQSPRQSPYIGSDPRQSPRPPQSPRPDQNQRQGMGPGPSRAGGNY